MRRKLPLRWKEVIAWSWLLQVNEMSLKKISMIVAIIIVVIVIGYGLYTSSSSGNSAKTSTNVLSFNQAVGQQAPDFTLQAIDGGTVKLSDYRGKNVVLFFNEGSMCYPACWDQMIALGNDVRFNTNDTVEFSIVVDQRSQWQSIISQTPQLSVAKILFDTNRDVSSEYDVLSLQSSMHPGSLPGHTFFIIDKEGVIRYALDDPTMAVDNDKLFGEMEKLV